MAGDELVAGESAPRAWGLEIGRVNRPMDSSDRPVPARPLLRSQEAGRQPLRQLRAREMAACSSAQPPLPQALHQPVDRQHSLFSWRASSSSGWAICHCSPNRSSWPWMRTVAPTGSGCSGSRRGRRRTRAPPARPRRGRPAGVARGCRSVPGGASRSARSVTISLVGAGQCRARYRVDRPDRQVGQSSKQRGSGRSSSRAAVAATAGPTGSVVSAAKSD